MNRDFIAKYWYAYIYEQQENHTNDVDFLLRVFAERTGNAAQNILEVACGGGRICVPLAQAGHRVTGFDADPFMLLRCYRRMAGLPNLRCYQADAIAADWGMGYDVVVMAGNVLINIETDMDYKAAQVAFIQKAAAALRPGGHLYMDFCLYHDPQSVFTGLQERFYFQGTDDLGTHGRTVSYGGVYDPVTQETVGPGHTEITTNNSETFIVPRHGYKHIPTQEQVYGWLADAGLSIERTYHNYTDDPIPQPIDETTYRACIWARKD